MSEGPYKGYVPGEEFFLTHGDPRERQDFMNEAAKARMVLLVEGKMDPRGLPWLKCCRDDFDISEGTGNTVNCAFVDKRITKARGCSTMPFVCVHRTTESGFLRVCAGWHAIFGRGYAAREQGEQGEQGEGEKK